ncbi:SDR family NAD(P)-dependent oxidoreductase [Streptomyces malaysiensis]|uniref:SDR family NAD(P)-dependent oxidoreductase n=1 Tax=Streptomyces malaysiensis TaxID=92644 RepID=UPI002B2A48E6|nr:SDR family oxidoreductase [Streptomyces malaysiensis]
MIITGAGSGIGAAVAEAFATAGDRVHLADLSAERLKATAVALGRANVTTHEVDVTDASAVQALADTVVAEHGGIDVLVSNAGVFDGCASIRDTTAELWDKVIGINLTGTFNVVKAVSEQMIAQRSGRVISIGSIAAQRAMPDGLAYCASKAALEGLVRRLAFDLGGYGITANLVAPGVVRTGIRATSEEILGSLVPDTNVGVGTSTDVMDLLIPARRGGEPAEIAATVFFLAGAGAAYINGEVIHVDGGWIAS